MRGALVSLLLTVATSAAGQSSNVGLVLEPAHPVKGRDLTARLEIELGAQHLAPPVLRANVGTIDSLERTGPGHFRARYVLPSTRFPEVAIIVAFSPWPHPQSVEGAFGVLRVPISSAVDVPGRAEPGAEVTLTLERSTFGPVMTAADGTFLLPVVVPPGFSLAKTTTRDRVGNRRTSQLDLMLPPTDQLACVVTPTRLPADGASRARVLCASSDRFGAAARGARVTWKGGRGTFSAARELGDGVLEWSWVAPRELGAGVERMTASWKQGPVDSREELAVELAQGPVRELRVTPGDEPVHLGTTWRARASAFDAQGRPLAGVTVGAAVSDPRGELELSWTPDAGPGPHELVFDAVGPRGHEPARLQAWRSAAGVGVRVTDLSGLPVPGQALEADGARFVTGDEGEVVVPPATSRVRHVEWPGLALSLPGALEPAPAVVSTRLRVIVAPAVAVNVRAVAEPGAVTWWLESPDGALVEGREVELAAPGGKTRATSRGKARAPLVGLVTVTDVESGVSAVVEVAP